MMLKLFATAFILLGLAGTVIAFIKEEWIITWFSIPLFAVSAIWLALEFEMDWYKTTMRRMMRKGNDNS